MRRTARDAALEQHYSDNGAPVERVRSGVLRVSEVTRVAVRWLWPGWLPRAKLVVLDGDPGLGKSTLTTDLAARVSTGSPMPDKSRLDRPASVVILTAEDGIGDTLRPRLEAAGADLDRIYVVETFDDDEGLPRFPQLPRDVDALQAVVEECSAALVIIDPIVAFLGKIDTNKDAEVRQALAPLARMADATEATVLFVRHLNKGGAGSALYRGGGSIGFIAACRAGLVVAADPDDDKRRVLAVSKSNLAERPASLAFRLVNDEEHECARVQFDGKSEHNADALLNAGMGGSALAEAREFLAETLADGPLPAKEVEALAKAEHISKATLRRAASGRVDKTKGKADQGGVWVWSLIDSPPPPPLNTFEQVEHVLPTDEGKVLNLTKVTTGERP